MLRESMTGDCTNRWADKSITMIGFNNGTFGAISEVRIWSHVTILIISFYFKKLFFLSFNYVLLEYIPKQSTIYLL